MKKILLLGCTVLLLGISGCQSVVKGGTVITTEQTMETSTKTAPEVQAAESEEEKETDVSKDGMMEAYQKVLNLENLQRKRSEESFSYYALEDVNRDSREELIIQKGTCKPDTSWLLYQYDGNVAYQIASVPAYGSLCKDESGNLYSFVVQMGAVDVTKLTWNEQSMSFDEAVIYSNEINDLQVEDCDTVLATLGLKLVEMKDTLKNGEASGSPSGETSAVEN